MMSCPSTDRLRRLGSALACSSFLLVAPTAAHEYSANYGFAWPFTGNAPAFDGAGQGFLEGDDALPDLVVLGGGVLYVMDAPGDKVFYDSFGEDITAFAVEHRLSGSDRLIASDDDGLHAYTWSSTTGTYAKTTLSTHPAYWSVAGLQVTTHPVSGVASVCTLQSDGQTLRTSILDGNTFTGLSDFSVGSPVLAWRALDWNGVGYQEFAVQTAAGLSISSYLGVTFLGPIAVASSDPCMWSYPDAGLGSDRLVLSVELNSNHYAYILDQRYPQMEPSIFIGQAIPGDFTLADLGGTSDLDLVVTTLNGQSALVYPGLANPSFPAESSFDSGMNQWAFGLGGAFAVGRRHLAAADFDLDGDTDIASTDGPGPRLFRSQEVPELDHMLGGPLDDEVVVTITPGGQQKISFPVHQPVVGTAVNYRCLVHRSTFDVVADEVTSYNPNPLWDGVRSFNGNSTVTASPYWPVFTEDPNELFQITITPLDASNDPIGPSKTIFFSPSLGGSPGDLPNYPPKQGQGPCGQC